MKKFAVFCVLLGIMIGACSQKKKAVAQTVTVRDTIYVPVQVTKAMEDSVAKLTGDTGSVGEFVSAAVSATMPLLPKGYVNDYVGLFTPAQIATLDSMIIQYEKSTTHEVAILTIDTLWTTRENFDAFVLKVHKAWGVGKKGKNNGIVIGIAPHYRLIRISNGYGIENKLTNDETAQIIQNDIVPEFKKGYFFEGTRKGLQSIITKVR